MTWPGPRRPFDAAAYVSRVRTGPCFVCRIVAGSPDQPERVLHRDGIAVTFLARPGVLPGHTLVSPVRHVSGVVAGFREADYLALQRRVWAVGQAVSAAVPTERLYVLSFGSEQGNSHVHWHVVPLPPGVPYPEQQFRVFDLVRLGAPDLPGEEVDRIATVIQGGLADV